MPNWFDAMPLDRIEVFPLFVLGLMRRRLFIIIVDVFFLSCSNWVVKAVHSSHKAHVEIWENKIR